MYKVLERTKKVHLAVVKHIFRYLIGISNLGFCFKKMKDFTFTRHFNADYSRDKLERNRINGSCHFIGCNLVTWICKKQGFVALSTTEAEYI